MQEVKLEGSVSINLTLEVLGVLSTTQCIDGLDVYRLTKAALLERVKARAEQIRLEHQSKKGTLVVPYALETGIDLTYDEVTSILVALVKLKAVETVIRGNEVTYRRLWSPA